MIARAQADVHIVVADGHDPIQPTEAGVAVGVLAAVGHPAAALEPAHQVGVAALPTVEHVVAAVAADRVVPGQGADLVVAVAAAHHVGLGTAHEGVVAIAELDAEVAAAQLGGAEVEGVGLPVAEQAHRPGGARGVDQFDAGGRAEAVQADVDPLAAVVAHRDDAVAAAAVAVAVVALEAVGLPVGMGRVAAAHFIGVVTGAAPQHVVIPSPEDGVSQGGANDGVVALATDQAELAADQGHAGEIEHIRLPAAHQVHRGGGDAAVAVIDGGGIDDLLDASAGIECLEADVHRVPAQRHNRVHPIGGGTGVGVGVEAFEVVGAPVGVVGVLAAHLVAVAARSAVEPVAVAAAADAIVGCAADDRVVAIAGIDQKLARQCGGGEIEGVGAPVAEQPHLRRSGIAVGVERLGGVDDQLDAALGPELPQTDINGQLPQSHDGIQATAAGIGEGVITLEEIGLPLHPFGGVAGHLIDVAAVAAIEPIIVAAPADAISQLVADDPVVAIAGIDQEGTTDQGRAGEIKGVVLPVPEQAHFGHGRLGVCHERRLLQ